MAANLTPQYHAAEARYKAATTPEEVLAALEEMWRELPKHKSSEKIQAELKKKLSAARKAVQAGGRQGGHAAAKVDPFAIPKTGAGQVALVGAPNAGKSALVGGLTNAHVKIAEFPFATALPVPGMVHFEDVQVQLVDTPPVTAEHVPPGSAGLWRGADALVVLVDVASDAVLEDVEMCLAHLAERQIELVDGPRAHPSEPGAPLRVPGLVLANKMDLAGAAENLELLREYCAGRGGTEKGSRDRGIEGSRGKDAPGAEVSGAVEIRDGGAVQVAGGLRVEVCSTRDAAFLATIPGLLFRLLRVIRVYAKPPGKKADMAEPFVLPAGGDVHEMARRVYRGFEQKIRSARIWGQGVADGQNVQLDHVLHDKDVVELHA